VRLRSPGTRTATNKVDYTYDPAGRLTTIGRLNGTVATTQTRTYTPDGMLAQTSNTTGTATTTSRYTWDPTVSQVPQLSSIETAGATWNLTYGPGGWASIHSNAVLNPVAVATDVHGSVIASTGNTLARNSTYTAYGTAAGTNTFEPRLGYRGELTLDNQLWLRARSYQSATGLMSAPDPVIGRPGKTTLANAYHYADNNPLNRIDPTGRSTQDSVSGTTPGTGAAVPGQGSSTECEGTCFVAGPSRSELWLPAFSRFVGSGTTTAVDLGDQCVLFRCDVLVIATFSAGDLVAGGFVTVDHWNDSTQSFADAALFAANGRSTSMLFRRREFPSTFDEQIAIVKEVGGEGFSIQDFVNGRAAEAYTAKIDITVNDAAVLVSAGLQQSSTSMYLIEIFYNKGAPTANRQTPSRIDTND
jgi:RHS repeat-associated protein